MREPTVIINAAGMGTRLGHNLPKSLVKVCGKPIIEWQLLKLCHEIEDIRLVIGFKGDELATIARAIRPSIQIIENPNWQSTKTAASLSLGMQNAHDRCISLDGDLLVAPNSFNKFIKASHNMIGVCTPNTTFPVYVTLNQNNLGSGFSYEEKSPFEWTGLVNFDRHQISASQANVYEMLTPILPIAIQQINCAEVDTPEDLLVAEAFWKSYE